MGGEGISLGIEEGDLPGHQITESGVLFLGKQESGPGGVTSATVEGRFHEDGGRFRGAGSAQFDAQGEVSLSTGGDATLDIEAEGGAEGGVLAQFVLVGVTIEQAGTEGMATVGVEVVGENFDQAGAWGLGRWDGGGGGGG